MEYTKRSLNDSTAHGYPHPLHSDGRAVPARVVDVPRRPGPELPPDLGLYPIVTLEKQLLNMIRMIGNLV